MSDDTLSDLDAEIRAENGQDGGPTGFGCVFGVGLLVLALAMYGAVRLVDDWSR